MLIEDSLSHKRIDSTAAKATSAETAYQSPDVLDKAGTAASLLCALHCALMPLAITLLPLVGLQFLAEGWVEWVLIGTSAILGVSSLCLGFKEHKSRRALAVLAAGLTLVVLGRIIEEQQLGPWGIPTLVLGGIVIAGAHLLNRKLCMDCRTCHPAGK